MAWFKVDDAFLMSSKVLSIPRPIRMEAIGVWMAAGVWSAHEMKDGLVPGHVLEDFGCREEIRDVLIAAGLWIEADNNAIIMPNWNAYQPTRDELMERREAVSEARKEAGKRSGEARRNKAGTNAEQNRTKLNPEPEPEPEPSLRLNNVSQVLNTPKSDSDDISSIRTGILNGLGVTNFMQLHTELVKNTGRDVDQDQAFHIVMDMLSKAKEPPKNAQGYLLASIRNSWAELQKAFDMEAVA
jgi:hypothetical protein